MITGILTAADNFTGRSATKFGLAERINLSFRSTPARTAAQLGGLRWSIDSGGGAFVSPPATDGLAAYVAPDAPARVTLKLQQVGGPATTYPIDVIAPNDALMSQWPGTSVWHRHDVVSVGFKGRAHLRPMDVSFRNIQWREGTAPAVASGYLAGQNGMIHPIGSWWPVLAGNSATGNQVDMRDTVSTWQTGSPFTVGDFLWPIPWQYRVGSGAAVTFTTANHHTVTDATGRATITKKGAGPFAKDVGDPASAYGIDGE